MVINVIDERNPINTPFKNDCYMDGKIGFWGNVSGVDSKKMTVRVTASTGQEFIGLPVMSNEWVNKGTNFVSCSRNLPPKGARVFVLMPTGTITGAFVLCSGYAPGDENTHVLFETGKESESKKITCGGWKETENYSNGNKTFESNNGNIKLELTTDSEIKITAFKQVINIKEDGISISSDSSVSISTDKNFVLDAGSNNIEIKASKFSVKKGSTTYLEVN